MNLNDWYVNEEIRRIERAREASPRSTLHWRLEWLAATSPSRRPVFAWLGDRLVDLGERLQSLAAPSADTLPARPGPSVPTA